MCSSDTPDPPPPAPPPASPPRYVDTTISASRDGEKNRLRALAGYNNSIATSGLGLSNPASTSGKQLTGQ